MYEQIISQYNTILCSVKNKTVLSLLLSIFSIALFLCWDFLTIIYCVVGFLTFFWFLVDNDCHYNTREFVYQ